MGHLSKSELSLRLVSIESLIRNYFLIDNTDKKHIWKEEEWMVKRALQRRVILAQGVIKEESLLTALNDGYDALLRQVAHAGLTSVLSDLGVSFLEAAILENELGVLKDLIEIKTDLNGFGNSYQSTALFIAVKNKKIDAIKMLLNAGVDLNLKSTMMCKTSPFGPMKPISVTPYEYAFGVKDEKTIQLLNQEALKRIQKEFGTAALNAYQNAAGSSSKFYEYLCHANKIKALLEGCPAFKDELKQVTLMAAGTLVDRVALSNIQERYFDYYKKTINEKNSLIYAVEMAQKWESAGFSAQYDISSGSFLPLLQKKACNVNETNEKGQTVLHLILENAFKNGQISPEKLSRVRTCLDYLIEQGAMPQLKDKEGRLPNVKVLEHHNNVLMTPFNAPVAAPAIFNIQASRRPASIELNNNDTTSTPTVKYNVVP